MPPPRALALRASMPKAPLISELALLESDVIHTMLAGLREYRSDLDYPESYSDMQACARGLFRMFVVQRRTLGLTYGDIHEPKPECVICGAESHLDMMGVRVCSNAHAREFADRMLKANPEEK